MIHLSSGEDSRAAIFADADMPLYRGPDPADICLPATQPIDISAYIRAAESDGATH